MTSADAATTAAAAPPTSASTENFPGGRTWPSFSTVYPDSRRTSLTLSFPLGTARA
ncbi:hypothetical protein [Streptomyces canus]|uniref:hypothetical protein n=1 Tax=Streptomyces canus TaxID=58343 RepID=UPI002E25F4AC